MSSNAHTNEFTLNLKRLPQSKSKDRLLVRFNAHLSRLRSAERGLEVSAYDVLNMTKRTPHEVELFVDAFGQRKGVCRCEAHVICKHILKSVLLHVARRTAQLQAEQEARRQRQQESDELWQQFARS